MSFDFSSAITGAILGNIALLSNAVLGYFMYNYKNNREEDKDAIKRSRDLINEICNVSIIYWSKSASIERNDDRINIAIIKNYFSQLRNSLHEIEHLDNKLIDSFLELKGVVQLHDFESPNRKSNKKIVDIHIPCAIYNMHNKITDSYKKYYRNNFYYKLKDRR